jgi:hypothetical protein
VFANSKTELSPHAQNQLDAIVALPARHSSMKSAVRDYLLTDRPLKDIAAANSYTVPAVLYWVRKLGLERRRRGRRALLQPTPEHQHVLELVRKHGISEAARRTGVSKQRVHELICRWAPELRGRRAARQKLVRPVRKRRVPRNIIVSFRITSEDWQRLNKSEIKCNKADVSGFGKARAIVLDYLSRSAASPASETGRAQTTPVATNENVYNPAETSVSDVTLL